jgi:two-component sensor histidine kinase
MLSDVAGSAHIEVRRTGSFGDIPAEVATALVLVLTELVQNAIEHAFPDKDTGLIEVIADRARGRLAVTIRDDGIGLPADFVADSSERLGLQIVRTLVSAELDGTVEFGSHDGGDGTAAVVTMTLGRRPRVGG